MQDITINITTSPLWVHLKESVSIERDNPQRSNSRDTIHNSIDVMIGPYNSYRDDENTGLDGIVISAGDYLCYLDDSITGINKNDIIVRASGQELRVKSKQDRMGIQLLILQQSNELN